MPRMLLIIFLILTFLGPLTILLTGRVNLKADYRTANRDSANLAPIAEQTPEAIVQIYTARAFARNGVVSDHTWIAMKPAHAQHYTVYQVIGWRTFRGLPPVAISDDLPDRNWYDQTPKILFEARGAQAERLIPQIASAAHQYPYPDTYRTWPGPNSNTFVAYILRQVPDLHVALPSNAIGKDFFPNNRFFAPAVSHTGYQFSLWGIFGITIAKVEGLEINLLGLVYGINPLTLTLKLPGFGDLSLLKSKPFNK